MVKLGGNTAIHQHQLGNITGVPSLVRIFQQQLKLKL
jgi:hypothetical protein